MAGVVYMNSELQCVMPRSQDMFEDEKWRLQKDSVFSPYYCNSRDYFDEILVNKWLGRRYSIELPPHSPDLYPMDFFLWRYMRRNVYIRRQAIVIELRASIEGVCAQMPIGLQFRRSILSAAPRQ
ncbi:hypothetical protein AVEN_10050-1 [Araneus ventricosus]|uniref:Tc1-like transposase DDE domain-containing protein n=1 Tax=Araneus ventricosus TaxID=182803 RepID=A0A4Y2WBA6_ARAVE|nr:hypothetical protein AVEN_10050-1 [Araneus ventricosus]